MRPIHRAAVLLCALALGAVSANAAPLRLDHLSFLPPVFGAGEEVEASAKLPGADAAGVSAISYRPATAAQAGSGDPELREIRVYRTPSGWELRIRFVPWSPGPGSLPAWRSKGVLIPPVPYVAASALGAAMGNPRGLELSPPRPQAEPPGTAVYVYGFAAFVLLLVLVCLGLVAWLIPAARTLLAKRRAAQAYRRLCRDMDFLATQAEGGDPVPFYSALARALRIYLGERVEAGVPMLSARELGLLPQEAFPAEGIREAAASLLAETEEVRYAGLLPAAGEMRQATERARAIGAKAEEALDAGL
ncbi:MAG TPA: hypothetical protein VFL04_04425 [Rectinemataceae bacterium]|nr:hypothetical protein [Rectinemataceae bacterium]